MAQLICNSLTSANSAQTKPFLSQKHHIMRKLSALFISCYSVWHNIDKCKCSVIVSKYFCEWIPFPLARNQAYNLNGARKKWNIARCALLMSVCCVGGRSTGRQNQWLAQVECELCPSLLFSI